MDDGEICEFLSRNSKRPISISRRISASSRMKCVRRRKRHNLCQRAAALHTPRPRARDRDPARAQVGRLRMPNGSTRRESSSLTLSKRKMCRGSSPRRAELVSTGWTGRSNGSTRHRVFGVSTVRKAQRNVRLSLLGRRLSPEATKTSVSVCSFRTVLAKQSNRGSRQLSVFLTVLTQ